MKVETRVCVEILKIFKSVNVIIIYKTEHSYT